MEIFTGKLELRKYYAKPILLTWLCIDTNCNGSMLYDNSFEQQGLEYLYLHTCDKCKKSALLKNKCYPKMEYELDK